MVVKTLIVLHLFLISQWAFGQEDCQGRPPTYQEALRCAEIKSPEVQRALLELERAKTQVGVASQWRNPELSADSVHGKVGSESAGETQVSLGVPIELGGKISARTSVAEGGVAKAEADLFAARASARSAALTKLHRLRQLFHEQEVVEESISTFSKLVTQYAKRFKLSPEQEMSVAVFKMAKSEYELRYAELVEELAGLDSFFKVALGTDTTSLKNSLPPSPKSWPKIGVHSESVNSPKMKASLAALQSAQAELSLAKSESWPTLTLGPSIRLQTQSGSSNQLYGFNLSLPLPLFNTNGAGRAAAAAGVKVAETDKRIVQSELERLREELLRVYEHSVSALGTTLSHQEIERKHSDVEKLFLKGIVPSSLVIEAHRTFVDLEKSRNEREIKALNALAALYTLDGKNLEIP